MSERASSQLEACPTSSGSGGPGRMARRGMGHAAAFGLTGDLLLMQPAKGARTPSKFLAPGAGI